MTESPLVGGSNAYGLERGLSRRCAHIFSTGQDRRVAQAASRCPLLMLLSLAVQKPVSLYR